MSRALAIGPDGRLADRTALEDGRVTAVLELLDQDGEDARVVGGAVRNALLGLPPGDIDIATTALPATVLARAKAARLRAIPTGIAHGTVTIVMRGLPLEITTLREDVATDGRHATVRFGRDFTADALRRDFTVNALSVDRTGHVHDCTGGVADLAAGRVRFIGDAETRIREDYLRVLRFFRFSAFYATGPLDPDGLAACAAQAVGLERLSRERVRAELMKLLAAPAAATVTAAMDAAGVLTPIVGASGDPTRLAHLTDVERDGAWPADTVRRLAALAGGSAPDVERLRDLLRLSNDERDRLLRLCAAGDRLRVRAATPDAITVLELLFGFGRDAALDAILLGHAASGAAPDDPAWRAAAQQAASVAMPSLPVSGADLLARGLPPGPRIGAVLKDVQARWIRAGFPSDPATLHRLLDHAVQAAGAGHAAGPTGLA